MITLLAALTLLIILQVGFYLASKVTPYDNEDYICPSRMNPHTNKQDRNDWNNS